MTRVKIVWVVVAVLGILSGLSVPRAQTTGHLHSVHTETLSGQASR